MEEYKKEVLNSAKEFIKKNDTIYANIRSVSPSGMNRVISFYKIKDNQPIMIDYLINELLDYKYHKQQGIKISGCGMDMGYHVVSQLSTELFGDYKLLNIKYL